MTLVLEEKNNDNSNLISFLSNGKSSNSNDKNKSFCYATEKLSELKNTAIKMKELLTEIQDFKMLEQELILFNAYQFDLIHLLEMGDVDPIMREKINSELASLRINRRKVSNALMIQMELDKFQEPIQAILDDLIEAKEPPNTYRTRTKLASDLVTNFGNDEFIERINFCSEDAPKMRFHPIDKVVNNLENIDEITSTLTVGQMVSNGSSVIDIIRYKKAIVINNKIAVKGIESLTEEEEAVAIKQGPLFDKSEVRDKRDYIENLIPAVSETPYIVTRNNKWQILHGNTYKVILSHQRLSKILDYIKSNNLDIRVPEHLYHNVVIQGLGNVYGHLFKGYITM